MKSLLYFYGDGCPDCLRVRPWVDRLEKDEGVEFARYEVWNNPENEARKAEHADLFIRSYGRATIVPAFVDVQRKRVLCNPQTFDELKAWVVKKDD